MNMKKIFKVCFVTLALLLMITGCEIVEEGGKRGKDWDYTVIGTEDVPEDFLNEINIKKNDTFQMSYQEAEYLYIAVGYGEQISGGFSIKVMGLYEQGSSLCMETSLNAPTEDEIVSYKVSYPYIVIKTQKTDKDITFIT